MSQRISVSGGDMKRALFAVLGLAGMVGVHAHARDQILSCNFNTPKDQKYFTDSSRIDKKRPALRLNVDRAEMYPSPNLGTITGIDLRRIPLENFVLITGNDGEIRVKYFIPNEILGENLDDIKLNIEVRWQNGDRNHTEMFGLNCDSRAN